MRLGKVVPPRAPRPDDVPPTLAGDNREYTRFLVLAPPRSGSSMLVKGLREHPAVVSFGEVFNPGRIGFNTPGYRNGDLRLLAWRNRHPVDFLETLIYRGYSEAIQAVGFKILYPQLAKPRFESLRAHLPDVEGLRVIHLRRDNQLRALVSLRIGKATGAWGIESTSQRSTLRVVLDPEDCVRRFERANRRQSANAALFSTSSVLELSYEALAADYDREMRRVQRFLGVGPLDLPLQTIRQEVRPLSVAIENYAELESAFEGTRWAEFLDG